MILNIKCYDGELGLLFHAHFENKISLLFIPAYDAVELNSGAAKG
jgi:hypothetical protein